jgi:hypothetical protein
MRLLTGAETPHEFTAPLSAWLFASPSPDDGLVVILCAVIGDQSALPLRYQRLARRIWLKNQFLNALLDNAAEHTRGRT